MEDHLDVSLSCHCKWWHLRYILTDRTIWITIPYLWALSGMYCRKLNLPLKGTMLSSITTFCPGCFAIANLATNIFTKASILWILLVFPAWLSAKCQARRINWNRLRVMIPEIWLRYRQLFDQYLAIVGKWTSPIHNSRPKTHFISLGLVSVHLVNRDCCFCDHIFIYTSRKLATLVFGLTGPPCARALPAHIGLRTQRRPALRADQSHNCPQTDRPIFII